MKKSTLLATTARRGPENKVPAAHENAAYEYVVENAGQWSGDVDYLAIVGESAGGNLAVNAALTPVTRG